MIITIGSDLLTTCLSFQDLGTDESFSSLGTSESYWSLGQIDSHIGSGTFSMVDRLEERSVCSFQANDEAAAYSFRKGMVVTVYDWDTTTLLFSGYVDEVGEIQVSGNTALIHTLEVVDNHYLADKRIVALSDEDALAGDIVQDIIDEYLAPEGVSAGTVQDGATISECIFAYVSAAEALDELAEASGFTWWIDRYKELHFLTRATNAAPWSPAAADMLEGSIIVTRGNPEYRNRQYVIGGQAETSPQTETFAGNGEQSTFTLGYPVKSITTIKVNDVEKTFGVRGDTGSDWYYAEQQNAINQDAGGAKLDAEDVLEVVYVGFYDVIAVAEDSSAVTDRQTVEGTTGYVEAVEVAPQIQETTAAEDAANAKLDKYAVIGETLEFTTRTSGLEAGQLATVTLAEHGFDAEEMLIQEVEMREDQGYIWYDVEAVSGPVGDSWQRFFSRLLASKVGQIKKSASGSELLIRMLSFTKNWVAIDDPNLFNDIYPDDGEVPDGATYPSFDEDDRVKYCALYDVGGEVFRKAITTITGEEAGTTQIVTTTMINASESVGEDITNIGWWAGVAAASGAGTGIELDKQAYVRTKTALEAWQVRKNDNRWS